MVMAHRSFGEAFMLYYALIGSRVRQTCDNL